MRGRELSHADLSFPSAADFQFADYADFLARPLMVRQPYSVAVMSTRGLLRPLVPEGSVPYKGNLRGVKIIEERLGEKGGAFLKGKEGFCSPQMGEQKGV